jgi:uncharacterized membrane protein
MYNKRDTMENKRDINLDFFRGSAIILMIIDHTLVFFTSIKFYNSFFDIIRETLTRYSMPLFMIISGLLLAKHGISIKRWLQVFLLSVFLNIIIYFYWKNFNFPEILLIWSLITIFSKILIKFPIFILISGLIQYQYFPINYQAYQPGIIVLFLSIGIISSNRILHGELLDNFVNLKIFKPIVLIGKYPLSIYFIHIIFLILILNLFF